MWVACRIGQFVGWKVPVLIFMYFAVGDGHHCPSADTRPFRLQHLKFGLSVTIGTNMLRMARWRQPVSGPAPQIVRSANHISYHISNHISQIVTSDNHISLGRRQGDVEGAEPARGPLRVRARSCEGGSNHRRMKDIARKLKNVWQIADELPQLSSNCFCGGRRRTRSRLRFSTGTEKSEGSWSRDSPS